jgi:hypothetical protein
MTRFGEALIYAWRKSRRALCPSHQLPESPAVASINDLFTQVAGDDAAVSADQAKLDADTEKDVSDHAGLNAAVAASGPTLVRMPDGTPVGLIPRPDGSIQSIVFKDGTATEVPATNPT